MRLNLRGKILATIALPLVVVLGGAEAYRLKQLHDEATGSTIERAQRGILREARVLDARLREVARIARDTAAFLEVNPDVEAIRLFEMVRRNVEADRLVYGAAIAFAPESSPAGGLFAPYAFRKSAADVEVMDIGRDGYDYTAEQWQWWHRPLERGFGVWTDAYLDEGAGNVWMVTFSAPFRRDGFPAGVATVDVALPTLRALVFDAEAQRQKLFVIGADLRMVFAHHTDDIGTPLATIAQRDARPDVLELGRRVLRDAPGYTVARGWDSGDLQWIFYAPVHTSGWVLGLRVDERAVFGEVRARMWRAAGFFGAALLVIVAGLLYVTRRVTRPVAQLDAAAHRVAQGDMSVDLPAQGDDEIARLSRSFTAMARAIVEREQALVAETAVREKIETELALAKELQRSMLPPAEAHDAAFGRYDVAAVLEPARAVGGDFFDYVVTADGRLVFVIADVSDKGVPAALFMVRAHTLLRSLAGRVATPAELLASMNDALCADNERCMFVTLACGVLELSSGRLALANAGHEPALRLGRDGRLEWLDVENGPALGLIEGTSYPGAGLRLEPGDALVLYTDGVSEAFDAGKQAFGRERIEAAVRARPQASALDLCAAVIAEVRAFVGGAEQSDDLTLLVVRWHGAGGEPPG
ncbi:MAG: SpoIIE family protein phosphatase [Burkholderiales bacterium]|nr:SpoIIE family protein phosphatase [Burkholderiales bacterium]